MIELTILALVGFVYLGPAALIVIGVRKHLRRVWLSGAIAAFFSVMTGVINANTEDFSSGLEAAFALATLVEMGAGIREWGDHWGIAMDGGTQRS